MNKDKVGAVAFGQTGINEHVGKRPLILNLVSQVLAGGAIVNHSLCGLD